MYSWMKSNWKNCLINFSVTVVVPIIAFFVAELFYSINAFTMTNSIIRLNLYVFYALFFFVLFFATSTKIAAVVTLLITYIFCLVNNFVFIFRGSPLCYSDILAAKTAMSVASNYTYSLTIREIFITLMVLLLIIAICFLPMKPLLHGIKRLIISGLSSIVVIYVFYFFFLSGKTEKWGLTDSITQFSQIQEVYKIYGSALSFTMSCKGQSIIEPEGYSLERVREIEADFDGQEKVDTDVEEIPNVIVMIDEAFSDPALISPIKTNEEYMPFLNSLSENTVKGTLYTSSFAGNTANTEFEFLTGNSMAFQPKGSIAFQSIKEDTPSLTHILKRAGYIGNFAHHPFSSDGWNRLIAYPKLGFDYFYSREDYKNPILARSYISDKSAFQKVIEVYEETTKDSQAPFYMYTMTMQNHSSYNNRSDNMTEDVRLIDDSYSDESVNNYLSLIKMSDDALAELVTYFEKRKDPTIIVFFGDHPAGLPNEFYSKLLGSDVSALTGEASMQKYQVPFVIWANYDIAEETIERISPNYMSSLLLSAAKLPMSGYEKYLTSLREDIPVITSTGYWGSDSVFYELKDTSSPYYEKIQDYSYLQYNGMYDYENRDKEFFSVP